MKYKRSLLGLFFILILILLMSYNYQEYDRNAPQIKKYKQIFNNQEKYYNTEISFMAQVKDINKTTQTIVVFIEEHPYTYPLMRINIDNLQNDMNGLKIGDFVDIIGILDDENHILAKKIWINEPWKNTLIYFRSLSAVPLILYLFFKTWRFNWKKIQFYRRSNHS